MILKGKILLEGWTESLIGVGSREKWRKGFGKNECYRNPSRSYAVKKSREIVKQLDESRIK